MDPLRDRCDVDLTRHIVSADVHSVPHSASSFDPSSLFFPFTDSGFSSLSAPTPLACFSALLSSSLSVASASSSSFSSSTVPTFSLTLVVPSVLSTLLPSPPPLPLTSSVSVASLPGFASSFASLPVASASCFPPPISSAPPLPWGSLPFSSVSSLFSGSSLPVSPSSSSFSSNQYFALHQAGVLGLSAEYQALDRWYVASRG